MSALIENLQNPDPQIRQQALQQASKHPASPEILAQIERLSASDPEPEIRAAARAALEAPNLRALRTQRLMKLSASEQRFILNELDDWQKQGLLQDDLAQALRSRYRIIVQPAPAPATQTETRAAPTTAPVTQAESTSTAERPAEQTPPAKAREPRPSLAQLLLSEASIKTFLYLGAFFVIAAAVILAALVEILRLPILSLALLAFGAAAIALKKRLPQPSFVLFIVFSFLLPINAGVFADLVKLQSQALAAYWSFVLLVCAAIWVFATGYYNSRFFSLSALGAFVFSGGFVPAIFGTEPLLETHMFAVQLANLAGLGGLFVLARKKNWHFAQPAFLFSQFINLFVVLSLVVSSFYNLFTGDTGSLWVAASATWLLAALYYAASHLLKPFPLFAWFASAALAPVIFILQLGFEFTRQPWAIGLGWTIWALTLTGLSEISYRSDRLGWLKNKTQAYALPLALAGIGLFLFGGLCGVFDSYSWGFSLFLAAAILLGLANLLRPRGWVWLASLVYGLVAYFLFFALPFLPEQNNSWLSIISLAAILFIVPDLVLRPNWKDKLGWFLPPRGLAIFVGFWAIFGILIGGLEDPTQSAICAILLSGTYWLYAIRYNKAWLGYLPALLLAVGLTYGFTAINRQFETSLGFAALSGLAGAYYLIGWALERFFKRAEWSRSLRWSGLALLPGLVIAALLGSYALEGWLLALLSVLLMAEARRYPLIETAAPILLIFGFSLILAENKVWQEVYHLAGMSALWLATNYIYKRSLPARPLATFTYLGAAILLLLSASAFFFSSDQTPAVFLTSLALAIFLLGYALLYRSARLGYIFTVFLAVSALSLAQIWLEGAWLWTLTPLALVYFGVGLMIRKDWGQTLRFSGLGLAGLTALSAPFAPQEGSGWFVGALTLAWLAETWLKKRPWAEAGFYLSGLLAFGLALYQYDLLTAAYFGLGMTIFLLGFDLLFGFSMARAPVLALPVRILGGLAAAVAVLTCIPGGITLGETLVAFGLSVFFGLYAPLRRQPLLGYVPAGLLAISALFALAWLGWWEFWLWTLITLAVVYYLSSLGLALFGLEWSRVLRFSGVGLGTLTSFGALLAGPSVAASIPVALAASLWAVEAFRRRNVWLGFPSNILYLMSYFMLLISLEVDQAQFYSVGAALLGLLMHYLLTRAGSDKGAFLTGLVSQLVLLGTTYIQMVATEQLGYFAALFFQSLVVLVYGLLARSRSLVGVPIAMLVLGVTTIVLFILRGLSTVILIGCTGIVMILVATLAVVLRERLAQVGERLSGWRA